MSQISPRLLSLGTAVPSHRITQADVLAILTQAKGKALPQRMADILGNTGIEQRYIAMPPEYYFGKREWPDRARVYENVAAELFQAAAKQALGRAGLKPSDIGKIVSWRDVVKAMGLLMGHAKPKRAAELRILLGR